MESIDQKRLSYVNISTTQLSTLIVLLGIFLRIFHFIDNRSLWGDEIMLAINIVDNNYWQLALPLKMEQYAPLGFLWIEKTFNYLLGDAEKALRFFPLCCGILAILFFHKLSKHMLNNTERLIALTLFAFAHPVIYYSVEVKQYETEMLIAILLYLSYYNYSQKVNLSNMVQWALLGAGTVWFSYSSIFVLVSISMVVVFQKFKEKRFEELYLVIGAFSIWALSFLINFYLFLNKGSKSSYLISYWEENFFPVPPKLSWFLKTTLHLFDNPLGLNWQVPYIYDSIFRFSVLGFIFLIIGFAYILKQRKEHICLCIPIIFICAASALQKYPIFERFILFYCPVLFIIIAKGAGQFFKVLKSRKYITTQYIIGAILVFPSIANSGYQLVNTDFFGLSKRREFKEVFAYLDKERKGTNLVYIHWKLQLALVYYNKLNSYRFNTIMGNQAVASATNLYQYTKYYKQDFEKLVGNDSVWLAVSTLKNIEENFFSPPRKVNEADFVKSIADEYGRLIKEEVFLDNRVYLYDFSQKNKDDNVPSLIH